MRLSVFVTLFWTSGGDVTAGKKKSLSFVCYATFVHNSFQNKTRNQSLSLFPRVASHE